MQLLSLSYKPWHWIAVLPDRQDLVILGEPVALEAGRLQASLVATPGLDLTLSRIHAAGSDIRLRGAGWQIGLAELRGALRQAAARLDAQELALELTDLAPDRGLMARLPAATELPDTISNIRIGLELGLNAPLDRHALAAPPQIADIVLREVRLTWGRLEIDATGRLHPDATGHAEGRIELRMRHWRLALEVAVAGGWLHPDIARTWAEVMGGLAPGEADGWLLLPLDFRKGRVSLGPLPLGPAPVLRPLF